MFNDYPQDIGICQGHQDPSKSVSIFLRETEANLKMVSINGVSMPRCSTVFARFLFRGGVLYVEASMCMREREERISVCTSS